MQHPQNSRPKNLYLRAGIWWARFAVGGEDYRRSLRTRSERVAVKRLAALRESIEDQAVFGIAGPVAWADAVVSWNAAVAGALLPSTFHRYVTSLRQLRGHLDPLAVHQIDVAFCKEIIKARRRAGVKNATIRRDLTALSSVLDHAADEGWIADNPAAQLPRRRLVPERAVRIELPREESITRAFARLPARIRDLCEFTRETGLRLDEATALKHAAVDRAERVITVEAGKGDKVRCVPLTRAAEAILDRQPRFIGQPWAFWQGSGRRITGVSSRIGGYMRRLAREAARQPARERTEFEPFSHHDFRHLFAVEYLRRGRGSIYDLQGEMGHTTIKTTERYLTFLTPEQTRAAKSGLAKRAAHEPRFGAGEA